MSNIKHFLRDVGYFGVGAAAAILEVGGKAVKALVTKGEKTLQDNQETVEELKRKTRELGDRMKATVEKASQKATPVDAAAMTPEERAELRRQLDEADQADEPVVADAIYHAEAPAEPEEPAEPAEPAKPAVEDVPEPEEPEEPAVQEPPILVVPEEDDPRDPFTRY